MRIKGERLGQAYLWRPIRTRLLALAALGLIACENQPTTPATSDETSESMVDFALTPEGALAAKAAKMGGVHKLGTVPARLSSQATLNASLSSADNSPFDLTFHGGRVVSSATNYPVYVNCPEGPAVCWGNGTLSPTTFLQDLNRSEFINIVREYTGSEARTKFQVRGMRTRAEFTNPAKATLEEILHILSDAVTNTGASGYGAIYHVFLPRGTDMCIAPGNCYSPSRPENWTFCAFHGSVNFEPNHHVLFTVEPYQAVEGCQFPGQTPNGVLDATASTLSHELFETITDPDLDGWFNELFGYEISDMCSAFGSNQLLNGHRYFIQSEYSNRLHLCTSGAPAV